MALLKANRPGRILAATGVVAAGAALCGRASAEPLALLTPVAGVLIARPIGVSLPGGYVGAAPMGGPLLGIEGSWAATLPVSNDASQSSAAFGVRAGWAFPNGLNVHARYDDLGVEPAGSRSPLQLATLGLRYSLPFVVPLPFAEVDAGPAFARDDVWFGAGAGLGASLPLGSYVLIDVVGRDWFVPVADKLRQTLTIGVGLTIIFPSPSVAMVAGARR